MYAWASEVFATICAAIFFPVNLEQLARENGVYASDRTTPCTSNLGNITNPSIMSLGVQALPTEDKSRCVIHFLGLTWMDSSSFALYTFSISTFLQTIVVVSMSGAADYGTLHSLMGNCVQVTDHRQLPKNVLVIVLYYCTCFNRGVWDCRCCWSNSLPPCLSVCN